DDPAGSHVPGNRGNSVRNERLRFEHRPANRVNDRQNDYIPGKRNSAIIAASGPEGGVLWGTAQGTSPNSCNNGGRETHRPSPRFLTRCCLICAKLQAAASVANVRTIRYNPQRWSTKHLCAWLERRTLTGTIAGTSSPWRRELC